MTQTINLLEKTRNKAPDGTLYRHALIGLALLVVALGTFWALGQVGLRNARAELARDQAASDRLLHEQALMVAPNAQWRARIDAEERDVQALEIIAQQLQGGKLGSTRSFAPQLRAFGRATTAGVWLTGLHLDNATESMALDGKATDASRLPGLLQALEAEPAFQGTRFEALELRPAAGESGTGGTTVVFHIATPAAASAPPSLTPRAITTAANP